MNDFADKSHISDGYHTFDELYEHRHALFIALCRELQGWTDVFNCKGVVWRSRLHADGTMYDGWFVMGIHTDAGKQISYHLPDRLWEATEFAPTLERGPQWDGHLSCDVVERLYRLPRKVVTLMHDTGISTLIKQPQAVE